MRFAILFLTALFTAAPAHAAAAGGYDLTSHVMGYVALAVFVASYVFVILEESLNLRKSKPVMLAAGIIWALVAAAHVDENISGVADALRHNLLEYAELLLFLIAAMTYIEALTERGVFDMLRGRLASTGLSLRGIYWVTGLIAFFLSPIADNLTTALVMGAVVLAVGAGYPAFIAVSCVNIVVAANAGGAFSPFGDITTLMVWQKGILSFTEFFALFLPALVSWLVPAAIMVFTVPKEQPEFVGGVPKVKKGGYIFAGLFALTVAMTVLLHHFLHLPPVLGMMTGLSLLMLVGSVTVSKKNEEYDIFMHFRDIEWDTLMFFYGVILCVGGLGAFGYLTELSGLFYDGLGATWANIVVGGLSALVDNIPIMFAVLTMHPQMDDTQWLLVTLTAGIGGSLLSVGSAAGVALMGQARGVYTFKSHFKWSWAVGLGYAAGIVTHLWLNGG